MITDGSNSLTVLLFLIGHENSFLHGKTVFRLPG